MKRELLERVLHSVIPRSQILEHARNGPKSASRSEKRMHSGTTVLAFRYADGVLFAADRKTSDSYLGIIDVDSYKIHQLSNLSIIGCAGSVGDIQFVVKAMEQVAEGFWGPTHTASKSSRPACVYNSTLLSQGALSRHILFAHSRPASAGLRG